MLFGKPGKKKREDKEAIAVEKALSALDVLKDELSKREIKKNALAFFRLVRRFFSDFYRLQYKFTYEELDGEIDTKRMKQALNNDLNAFLTRLSAAEYGAGELAHKELAHLISEFRSLVHRLRHTKDHRHMKKTIFLSPLSQLKRFVSSVGRKTGQGKREADGLESLLSQAATAVSDRDLSKARSLYRKIGNSFKKIPAESKSAFYPRILELYERITAISPKV